MEYVFPGLFLTPIDNSGFYLAELLASVALVLVIFKTRLFINIFSLVLKHLLSTAGICKERELGSRRTEGQNGEGIVSGHTQRQGRYLQNLRYQKRGAHVRECANESVPR